LREASKNVSQPSGKTEKANNRRHIRTEYRHRLGTLPRGFRSGVWRPPQT
jgi:hypothetical protein